MRTTNICEAKPHFLQLIDRVAHGEEITIGKGREPIAKFNPLST